MIKSSWPIVRLTFEFPGMKWSLNFAGMRNSLGSSLASSLSEAGSSADSSAAGSAAHNFGFSISGVGLRQQSKPRHSLRPDTSLPFDRQDFDPKDLVSYLLCV